MPFHPFLCLRSTLRLFQFWMFHFWIFHRCNPKLNLKTFCHSLRHEIVSHLFPFLMSISKLALRLFDLILSKTRFSSHITFISRCLHGKVIPHGFRSSFNPLRFNLPAFHRRFSHSMYSTSMRTFRNVKYFFLRFVLPFYFRTSLIKFAC